MISAKELAVLRELGAKKREIGELEIQKRNFNLWRDVNSLRRSRPAVKFDELPWSELEAAEPEDLKPVCSDPFLREIETGLRQELYQWNHFPVDMIVEPIVYCNLVAGPSSSYADYGIKENPERLEGAHDVVYRTVIDSLEQADMIQTPKVWHDKVETERRFALLLEIFAGVIPVKKRGIVHQWHAAWDQIIHWYRIEQLYTDMYERPELVHRIVANFTKAQIAVLDEQERLGLLDTGNGAWRVGSGGYGVIDGLPERVEGRNVVPGDQWGCANAQIFSEVSPEMHYEFSLQYDLQLLQRYRVNYYGCCEPLHRKFEMLRKIPNLRKISASPKAKIDEFAAQAGREFVVSWKPNPAILATNSFDEVYARKYLRDAIDKCAGCNMEIILKDVSTIRGDPKRLAQLGKIAMEAVCG